MARILVIDDDDQVRRVLVRTLQREDYDVDELDDGEKALKSFRQNKYDLLITDIIMPGKEGIETMIEIKREFPGVKVIAISGGGRISSRDCLSMAKHMGAKYTFSKPFERSELLEAVKELIDE